MSIAKKYRSEYPSIPELPRVNESQSVNEYLSVNEISKETKEVSNGTTLSGTILSSVINETEKISIFNLFECFGPISYSIFSYFSVKDLFSSKIIQNRASNINIQKILKMSLNTIVDGTMPLLYKSTNIIICSIRCNHMYNSIRKSKKLTEYLIRTSFLNRQEKVVNFNESKNHQDVLVVTRKDVKVEFIGNSILNCMWVTQTNETMNNQMIEVLKSWGIWENIGVSNEYTLDSFHTKQQFHGFCSSLTVIFVGTVFSKPLELWCHMVNQAHATENMELCIRLDKGKVSLRFEMPRIVFEEGLLLTKVMEDLDRESLYLDFLIELVRSNPLLFAEGWFNKCKVPLIFPHHPSYFL